MAPVTPLKLTVHVEDPEGPSVGGLQDSDVTVIAGGGAGTMMVPPVAETAMDAPSADAPKAPVTPMDAVVADGVRVAVTTATTPSVITLELMPYAMHIYPDASPAQEMDFPAAVATAPGVMLSAAMLALG